MARGWAQLSDTRSDVLFLGAIMALSAVLYVQGLGWYYDDWHMFGALHTSVDQSFLGLVKTHYAFLENDLNRPLQAPYVVALFQLAGDAPLLYHLANTIGLIVGVVLFYVALTALHVPRSIAVSLPLIYGLLPNYSSDRFWFIAGIANWTVVCCFAGLYALARTLDSPRPGRWHLASFAALVVCGLIYEMYLPLFVLSPFLVWVVARHRGVPVPRGLPFGVAGVNVLLILALMVYKLLTTERIAEEGTPLVDHLYLVYWLFSEVATVNVLQHGLGTIPTAWQAVQVYPDRAILSLGIVTGAGVFAYLFHVTRAEDIRRHAVMRMLGMALFGVVVLMSGYAVFMFNYELSPSHTGDGNRTAIAGAVGAAMILVAVIGLIAKCVPSRLAARIVGAGLVAVLSTACFVVTNTLATFWVQGWEHQQAILAGVKEELPELPTDSTVLLDGFCSYVGPAIVFTITWDTTGALKRLYSRPDIRGDAVATYTYVDSEALTINDVYPYERLYIYNHANRVAAELTSADSARAYFAQYNPDHSSGCPPFEWGNGVAVF